MTGYDEFLAMCDGEDPTVGYQVRIYDPVYPDDHVWTAVDPSLADACLRDHFPGLGYHDALRVLRNGGVVEFAGVMVRRA